MSEIKIRVAHDEEEGSRAQQEDDETTKTGAHSSLRRSLLSLN